MNMFFQHHLLPNKGIQTGGQRSDVLVLSLLITMIFSPQVEKVIGVFHQQPLRRDLSLLETHPLKRLG